MKVDVNIIRKPGVRVEVNLARGRHRGRRVSVPVRVAPYLAEDISEAELPDIFEPAPAEELPAQPDAAPAESEAADQPCSEEGGAECADEYYDEYSDEYGEEYDEDCDEDCCEAAEVDFYPDDEASEDTVPDEESLLRLIEEEEAEMAASGLNDRPLDGLNLPGSHFMSYLDRTEDGDVFEVDGTRASGQKIVSVDSESGRISRVCGFIKHGNGGGQD